MKITTPCGTFWMEETPDGLAVGLTAEKMASIGVIWTFFPKAAKRLKLGDIFANFESSKTLGPLRSPVSCVISGWNIKWLEKCETVTADDYIFIGKVKEKADDVAVR